MGARYAVGIDFGTESGRAVLVDVADGRELATAVYRYRNGVIDEHLPEPDADVNLGPDWALQDPEDYLRTIQHTVPSLLAETGVAASSVVGLGIDFTACTMLPTTTDGTPLCSLPRFRREPHAWVKLWKHHAAQPEADRLNDLARERGEPWLARYGGKISSEWFFPKALQILDEAPEIYAGCRPAHRGRRLGGLAAHRGGDAQQLHGGLQGNLVQGRRLPPGRLLRSPRPTLRARSRREDVAPHRAHWRLRRRSDATRRPDGPASGRVRRSRWRTSTPTSRCPAATVTEPGTMVAIMGTSICHMVLGSQSETVEGMCGVVEDGIIPGLFGFEAGQSAVGDIFAWFVENCVPAPEYARRARSGAASTSTRPRGGSGEAPPRRIRPARPRLVERQPIHPGRRRPLWPAGGHHPRHAGAEEIYRALIEATAFGTRTIIGAFEANGVPVGNLVACGGLPERSPLVMQIYADVTGREVKIAASQQTPALGSAMFGAVAAAAYGSIVEAAQQMARLRETSYRPIAAHRAAYDELYAEYVRLHDLFGRGPMDVMKRLRSIRDRARSAAAAPSRPGEDG